ncbi:MAG: hypothetical protein CMJ31_01430, partial [Phycisphaerae bacterium]|nr:hypothetical protein [Phycisphaerae bacterium]
EPDDTPAGEVDRAVADAERRRSETADGAAQAAPRIAPRPDAIDPAPIAVATTAAPGLTHGVDWLLGLDEPDLTPPAATALPERTFLRSREGLVQPGPYATWIFSPTPTEDDPSPRAMLLHPSRMTQRLAAVFGDHGGRLRMELSGELFLYRGRNYLLPSNFELVHEGTPGHPVTPPDADATVADAAADATPDVSGSIAVREAGDVANLIAELRELRGEQDDDDETEETPASSANQRGPVEADPNLIAEGKLLTGRRGRIERLADGLWAFMPDNDEDEPVEDEDGIALLPSMMLTRIERIAEVEGDLRAVVLSGRVTVYEGKNYILPTLMRLPPPDTITPLQ